MNTKQKAENYMKRKFRTYNPRNMKGTHVAIERAYIDGYSAAENFYAFVANYFVNRENNKKVKSK